MKAAAQEAKAQGQVPQGCTTANSLTACDGDTEREGVGERGGRSISTRPAVAAAAAAHLAPRPDEIAAKRLRSWVELVGLMGDRRSRDARVCARDDREGATTTREWARRPGAWPIPASDGRNCVLAAVDVVLQSGRAVDSGGRQRRP